MDITPAEKSAVLALVRASQECKVETNFGEADKTLWDSLEPKHQRKLHHLAMVIASNHL